ncbi:MAG TPA: type II secretion system protein [Kofleriaceae bacterium]|nr:type II secretion system protein [Kofleriaceae bacterium]
MDTSIETPEVQSPAVARLVRQAGMTLLEILIVLAIIALVMGFLFGPRLMEMFGESKTELAKSMVQRLATESYARWTMDNQGKACPADVSEVAKYSNDKEGKDPWGHPMILLCGENVPEGVPGGVGVVSMGSDGKLDTKDDLKSWDTGGAKTE